MNAFNRWLDRRSETFIISFAVVEAIVVVGGIIWLAIWLHEQGVRL